MTDKMKNILESEHGKYLSLLARLCDADGPSGFEDKIKDIIIEEASPYADKLYIDRMGSVIVFKKGILLVLLVFWINIVILSFLSFLK